MAPEEPIKYAKASKQEFNVLSNRLAIALAKRESLVRSWAASSSRPRQSAATEAELDAEDAALFHNEPAHLGVGAPIPSKFLTSESERNNKTLRAKLLPAKGLKASKARDADEKAASAKRALKEDSSDEEEGRSGLGRSKKVKTKAIVSEPVKATAAGQGAHQPLLDIEHLDSQEQEAQGQSLDTSQSKLHGRPHANAEIPASLTNELKQSAHEPKQEGGDSEVSGRTTAKDRKKRRRKEKKRLEKLRKDSS